MFEDVRKVLIGERDSYKDHLEWASKDAHRITEILNDFENYDKFSLEALYHRYREPNKSVTQKGLRSCLKKRNAWIKTDRDKIDEINLALSVLQKYADSRSDTGGEIDV